MSTTAAASRRPRFLRISAMLLAVGLTAAACGDDTDDGADSTTTTSVPTDTTAPGEDEDQPGGPTPGGRLTVALEAEQNSWLPGRGNFANAGTAAARAVYDSIAARGDDGQVYPYLAESIRPNDDLTEWTVTLREGIELHDGTPLDAELMKRIYDEYLDVDDAVGLPALISTVEDVRIDDELVYTYVLSQGVAPFPDVLVGPMGWPFSIDACEEHGGRDGDCGDQMVGAGPFEFVSWSRDNELVLRRNDDYWRVDADGTQLPYLDELVFRPIPDEDSRLAALASGSVEMAQTLRQEFVGRARDMDGTTSHEALGNNGGGSIFNTERPPVDDVRVRLGLAHAIDQVDLIGVLGGEGITPTQSQFFSPQSPWYSSVVEELWPTYDPELAASSLQEYIDDPDRSDGRAPGQPIAIEFNCPTDQTLVDLAQAYHAYWQAVGVEVTLNQVDQTTHISNAVTGDYLINCWRSGSQEDPYVPLSSAFTAGVPSNVTNYSSATIDENLEILRTTTDFDERYAAVEAISIELAEQVPQIWTGGTATALVVADNIRNVDGWTIPGPDRSPLLSGDGVLDATIYWAEIWIEQ